MARRMRRCLQVALAAGAMLSILAPSAGAAPWTQVTTPSPTNLDQVGVVRTPDGIAHLLWLDQPSTSAPETLMHSAFDQAGNPIPGATVPVVSNWNGINESVEVVYVPAGAGSLVAIWSGFRTLDPGEEFNGELIGSVGTVDGKTWGPPLALSESEVAYVASGIGADADPRAGQSVVAGAWGDSAPGNNGYSFGAAFPNPNLSPVSILVNPEVAIDAASGTAVGAWQSLAAGNQGIFASPLGPSAPLAAPLLAPGSASGGSLRLQSQRTAITALQGAPGIYLAYGRGYPSTFQIRLWRMGAAQATALLNGKKKNHRKRKLGKFARDAEAIGIAKADGGRLWIFWERHGRLYAVRTNPAAIKAKRLASVKPPKGTDVTWRLTGEGSAGPLDLFAQIERDGETATWHTQVLPSQLKKHPK